MTADDLLDIADQLVGCLTTEEVMLRLQPHFARNALPEPVYPQSLSMAELYVANMGQHFNAFGAFIHVLRNRWSERLAEEYGIESGAWDVTNEVTLARALIAETRRCARVDPLAVECTYCDAVPTEECITGGVKGGSTAIHRQRYAAAIRKGHAHDHPSGSSPQTECRENQIDHSPDT